MPQMETDVDQRRKKITDLWLGDNNEIIKGNIYEPENGDIIVVGAPKSGTTWMQQILHQIRTKGDESFDDIYEVTRFIPPPLIGFNYRVNVDQRFRPRVFKHHESYGIIESGPNQKHVVIVRDPFDAMYSWYKWFNGFFGGCEEISDNELAETILKLNQTNRASSFHCVSTWWMHRNDPNVLFLFYEDVKDNLLATMKQISAFVRIPLSEDELNRAAHFSSFDYMVKHKEKFRGDFLIEALAGGIGVQTWAPTVGMVRPGGGKVGEGMKNIGPKLKETVETLWKDILENQTGFSSYTDMRIYHHLQPKL